MENDYTPNALWRTKEKLDVEMLSNLDSIIKMQYTNIEGILILQDGYILHEKYYHGKNKENKFHVASVTKSVLSALIGIAIDKGYIKSVDEKVISFFSEYEFNDNNSNRNRITIHHLLTMTAPFPFLNMREPLERMCRQKDWIKYSLEILGEGRRIGKFKYSTAGAHILSAILTKSTGMSAREFANLHLFEPLGIEKIPDYPMVFDLAHVFGDDVRGWVSDSNQYSAGGWGLTLTLREMAKFGLLYQKNGAWKNEQVISKEWVDLSTNSHGNDYGYLWWIGKDKEISSILAVGSGGNLIGIFPEKRLTIAIASQITQQPRDREKLIKKYILPFI
jgi:CubicO group peptidase (beta-lactamase class C family)